MFYSFIEAEILYIHKVMINSIRIIAFHREIYYERPGLETFHLFFGNSEIESIEKIEFCFYLILSGYSIVDIVLRIWINNNTFPHRTIHIVCV